MKIAHFSQRPIVLALTSAFILLCLFAITKLYTEHKAKTQLGGDIEISRQTIGTTVGSSTFLSMYSLKRSAVIILNSKAITSRSPNGFDVTVKAIDRAYPLYGKMTYEKKRKRIFTIRKTSAGRIHGAAVNKAFLEASGLKLRGRFTLDRTLFEINAIIDSEPDVTSDANLSPRVLITNRSFPAINQQHDEVAMPVMFHYRVRLDKDTSTNDWREHFQMVLGTEKWSVYDWRDFVPFYLQISWMWIFVVMAINLGALGYALYRKP